MEKPSRKGLKRFLITLTVVAAVVCVGTCILTAWVRGEPFSRPAVVRVAEVSRAAAPSSSLRLVTLNLAHGRSDGMHQVFLKESEIRTNLQAIAKVLVGVKADVVAVQEADGESLWSGNFDHLAYLAKNSELPFYVRGEHVCGLGLSYGTGVLSGVPLTNATSVTFAASPPTFPKGFVATTASIDGPGGPREVDVVSVHLDFSRASVRQDQVERLIAHFDSRERPLIVLGDFNCEWEDATSPLKELADRLGLRSHRPKASDLETFPLTRRRLDWIFVSSEFDFRSYQVVSDVISDHQAVVAEVVLKR